jgi:hypothetical protein
MSEGIDMNEATGSAGAGDGLAGLRRSLAGAVLAPPMPGSMRHAAASISWSTAGRP